MRLLRSLDDLPRGFRAGALSIGNFDGVHRGHARLVERLTQRSIEQRGPSVIFTFDPHPVRLLRPAEAPPPLTWTERKAELLTELGVEMVVAYPTDEQLLNLSPEEFFQQVIVDRLRAGFLVEGPNFFFGKDRRGDVRLLERLCAENNVRLEIVPPLRMGDELVSSSRIRRAIADGDVEFARRMMTQPYRVRGMVTHGARRGARLGFPTANLEAIDTLLPRQGVYAGRAWFERRSWTAAIHIGPNPTFAESSPKVEVHLLDFDGVLYGLPLEVDFCARLRDIRTFASAEELKQQIEADVRGAREAIASLSPHEFPGSATSATSLE